MERATLMPSPSRSASASSRRSADDPTSVPPSPPAGPRQAIVAIFQDLISDIKSRRWIYPTSICVSLAGTLVAILFLISAYEGMSSGRTSACHPDGSFEIQNRADVPWVDSQNLVQITFGWGSLSFTQAKLIDIAWDLVVGRGGQLLLAMATWKAFAAYMRMLIQTEPTTYRLFRMAFIEDGPSLRSLGAFIRDVVKRRAKIPWPAAIFMVYAIAFVLLFSTLMSALSGYASRSSLLIEDVDGKFIPFSSFSIMAFELHDGQRVGLSRDLLVPVLEPAALPSTKSDPFYSSVPTAESLPADYLNTTTFGLIEQYIKKYETFNESRAFPSVFAGQSLPSPLLNITIYKMGVHWWQRLDPAWKGYHSWGRQPQAWLLADRKYDQRYLMEKGVCQAGPTYIWGFSFAQLLIVLILLLLWTTGTSLMWIRASSALASIDLPPAPPGIYTSMLALSDNLRRDFADSGTNFEVVPEKQIQSVIRKRLDGGRILLDQGAAKVPGFKSGVWKWLKARWVWLLLLMTCTAGFLALMVLASGGTVLNHVYGTVPGAIGWLAIMVGYFVGRRTRTKLAAMVGLGCIGFIQWALLLVLPWEVSRRK